MHCPLHDRDGLTNLVEHLYNPTNPNFRHYLTLAEFAARFAPKKEEYEAVAAFAQAQGLAVTRRHLNRMLLDVNGSVADIERAFHITLRVYPHPSEARTFFAPDTDPAVAADLPILHVSGLDNYSVPHPRGLTPLPSGPPRGPQPNAGSGPGGSFLGHDFRAAYLPGVSFTGAGQIVGLVEFDGYNNTDITNYEHLAGQTNVPLQNVLLNGYSGNAGANNSEVALDIEMTVAMAPGLARVLVYEGVQPNDVLNQMAMDNQAKQLSSSWTWGSGDDPTTDQIFQEFAAQGQSFFQASGDDGAATGPIDAPADSPYATVVGGTTLTTAGPGGAWVSETPWNLHTSREITTGGSSTSYGIPTWQTGIDMSTNQGSTTARNIPDVVLVADNVWVIHSRGAAQAFNGTSCGAPLWGGIAALINEARRGCGRAARPDF